MTAGAALHLACAGAAALLRAAPPTLDWLSLEEAARHAAMRSPGRRRQFLAARWQARLLLARVQGGQPRDWMLTAPPDAPPRVAADPGLFLSVSHSGDWSACALSRAPLGLDLEAPRGGRDIAGLAALCCTPGEQAAFADLSPRAQDALFHELWTVKEAWLKRRHEWIAPSRLATLDCRRDPAGEVRTWCAPAWTLALCAPAGTVHWHGDEPLAPGAWAVVDRAPAAAQPA